MTRSARTGERKNVVFTLMKVFSLLFFSFILWIIYTANTGGSSVFFELVAAIPYGDKLGHILLFGILTLAANICFKFSSYRLSLPFVAQPKGASIYWGTTLVLIFVCIEEMSQAFIPSRTFDWLDLTADGVGISLFSYASYRLARILSFKR